MEHDKLEKKESWSFVIYLLWNVTNFVYEFYQIVQFTDIKKVSICLESPHFPTFS